MSQHSQRTQQGPSRASIIGTGVAAVAALVLGITVAWRPAEPDWWHITGAFGWMFVGIGLMNQAVTRFGDRQAARDRAQRAADAEHAARQLARLNTGTWQGDAVGQVLTVRYDPASGRWHVQGWMGDHAVFYPERHWADRDTLFAALAELEITRELEPQDDEGTRAVRARLGLPGPWFDTEEPDPAAVDHWATGAEDPRTEVLAAIRDDLGVEDTQRLQRPGPSPAALRPIQVPVFRSEAERAVWAAEHEIPTEFLPRLP